MKQVQCDALNIKTTTEQVWSYFIRRTTQLSNPKKSLDHPRPLKSGVPPPTWVLKNVKKCRSELNWSASFQVHLSGRNEIEVLVNGDIREFTEQFMVDFNGVIVLKCKNTPKYSIIFTSGITVTVEKAGDILQMMLLVPPVFTGAIYHFSL